MTILSSPRRALATIGVLAGVLLSGALAPASAADRDPGAPGPVLDPPALSVAERVLAGRAVAADPSATVALRDLRRALPSLSGEPAARAREALARPTDRRDDYAYDAPATKVCNKVFCVHYVTEGPDAPTSPDWPARVLDVMTTVYDREVGELGFDPPLRDGRRGGNAKFDVYLADLGPDGLYGYCAPERRRTSRTYTGYCTLDNDYDPAQYAGQPAENSLLVTAAHEFFHAIQFGYDATEDRWMLEATATWMEDQVADDIDDNRQYLQFGQLYAPQVPLDAFSDTFYQYGNWIFWEYLSQSYGRAIVRKAWTAARGPRSSLPVLERLLARHGGLGKVYARFAAGNLDPARTYAEGAELAAPTIATTTLTAASTRLARTRFKVDHLASASSRLVPGPDLADPGLRLDLRFTVPSRRTSPVVAVSLTRLDGTRKTRFVKTGRSGRGRISVPFSTATLTAVDVTLANTSTRFRCGRDTDLACSGVPRDDRRSFTVRGAVR